MAALNNKRLAKSKLSTGNFKRVTANSSLSGFPVSHEKPDDDDDDDDDDDYYFCKNLLNGINQTLDSSVAQALSEAARFVRFVEESACYFKATLKNQLLDYITTKPARLNGTRYGECVMTRNSDNRAGNFSYDHSRKPGKPNQQPDRG
ncbi:unnamed protein product [Porites evermanni]|uniref:Histone H2A/H2B/H3 domain-containing protein n=1 Tax=Porites evermanni TaxID=104178 RepID=A0ABN8SBW0_9CNID|nr:unnamed protein product [Porites evermanni]